MIRKGTKVKILHSTFNAVKEGEIKKVVHIDRSPTKDGCNLYWVLKDESMPYDQDLDNYNQWPFFLAEIKRA